MSKSRGNVVDPVREMDRLSADGLRYFLMKEGVPHSDGSENMKELMNCDAYDYSDLSIICLCIICIQ